MVNLPLLRTLSVSGYGLYPGFQQTGIDLSTSLTLVLGANGIGKTSLVSLLFRMLTGPSDVPAARGRSLSRGSLQEKDLDRAARRYFANRVNDGATTATATLTFELGAGGEFEVTRNLRDLSLVSASASREDGPSTVRSEEELRRLLVESSELGTFSDWILLLRYVVFYQEDRQALLWDEVAQAQILRPLFLSPADSNEWAQQEREIFAIDSRRRNLSASIFSSDQYVKQEVGKQTSVSALNREIEQLDAEYDQLNETLADTLDQMSAADQERRTARLDEAIARDDLHAARELYERAKVENILESFPSASATSQYILSRLLEAETCIACGRPAPELQGEMERRISEGRCVLCGQDDEPEIAPPTGLADASGLIEQRTERLAAAETNRHFTEDAYESLLTASRVKRSRLSDVESSLADLRKQLPAPEGETAKRLEELGLLRRQLAGLDATLEERRSVFNAFVQNKTDDILGRANEIESAFIKYASSFLLEENRLTWTRRNAPTGQYGATVPFPHFSLQMRGSDFTSVTPRATADSVSESQREFVDLAFRMALVDLASSSGASLVIDSPDSSLDAVFEPKAAEALSEFISGSSKKRLVLTSNISSGAFLPDLIKRHRMDTGDETEIVDLFALGVSTAAVRELAGDYRVARESLNKRSAG